MISFLIFLIEQLNFPLFNKQLDQCMTHDNSQFTLIFIKYYYSSSVDPCRQYTVGFFFLGGEQY
jgi:hypothetical protein